MAPPPSLELRRDVRLTVAEASRQLSAMMRAHNLPSPGLAMRAAAGWSVVMLYYAYYQVQPSWESVKRHWRGEKDLVP